MRLSSFESTSKWDLGPRKHKLRYSNLLPPLCPAKYYTLSVCKTILLSSQQMSDHSNVSPRTSSQNQIHTSMWSIVSASNSSLFGVPALRLWNNVAISDLLLLYMTEKGRATPHYSTGLKLHLKTFFLQDEKVPLALLCNHQLGQKYHTTVIC